MARGWIAALALLAAACGGAGQVAGPSPSAPPVESPSPVPSPSPSARPAARTAEALVYADQGAVFLYDPKADSVLPLASGEDIALPRFVARDRISLVERSGGISAIRIVGVKDGKSETVVEISGRIATYGWSPDRTVVGYVVVDDRAYPHLYFHTVGGARRKVATLARALGRGGSADDQVKVEFSRRGDLVLVVFTPADGEGGPIAREAGQLQVRRRDGTLAFAPDPAREPTMALWSADGRSVYYRDAGGIRLWNSADDSVVGVGGVKRWYNPQLSPDGRRIAYDSGDALTARTFVYEIRTRRATAIGAALRARPVFVAAGALWLQELVRCTGDCFGPTLPGGRVFRVEIGKKGERRIAAASLADVDVYYR